MADIDKEITVKVKAEDDTQKATQSAKARLRELQAQMLKLEEQGQKNTDAFRRMAAEAGSLKDAIGDTSAQVKVLASDTRTLDTFTSAIQGIAGGFAVAQGAAALFGEENEDVQKAMMKVQAALALVNGATALANTLNKDSALMVNLNAAAQRAYALAVGTSTGALKAFRIALVTTGLGALVVALGFAVEALLRFTSRTKEQENAQENLNEAVFESVNMLDLYERKLKAQGATDEQIAKVRIARFTNELETAKSFLAVLEVQMRNNATQAQRDLQLRYIQEIELLKVKVAEENKILDDARKSRQEEEKSEAVKRRKENEVGYMELIGDFQKYWNEILKTNTYGEMQIRGARREGVKELMAQNKAAEELENMREQRRVDRAKQTLQGIADLTTLFAGKSEKAQRRAFDVNKKASMGTAIIDGIAATQKAFKSAPPPLSYVLAAAAAAAALARVKQISQQQFQSPSSGGSGGAAGGGGGAEGGMAAPQGNALNPSGQLLNPNTGQAINPQPLRAYVVESDVSGVQQRLRQIRQFAQLGMQ